MIASVWEVPPRDPAAERHLAAALGVSPLVAAVLRRRGLAEPEAARAFLHPSLAQTHDCRRLRDIDRAVERLMRALQAAEPILIHGDYDADGVTAAALLYRLLSKLGARVSAFIPHRLEDGFGVQPETVRRAAEHGVQLILTADCGSSAAEAAETARHLGLDFIVTDHHEPPEVLPKDAIVVNPRRADCDYPYKDLSGVGVAFKLGEALVLRVGWPVESYRSAFVDLACVGTVADVCPLLDENRALVRAGLEALPNTKKLGLKSLARACDLGLKASALDVAFRIGPRLNAAGRMGDATAAFELLVTNDEQEALHIARRLESLNRERRGHQDRIFREACQRVYRDVDLAAEKVIVLHSPDWHLGVLGIVAQKLVESFRRPAILFGDTVRGVQGSARSVSGFNILQALEECAELLLQCGGHAQAAGLTVDADRLPALRQRLNEVADRDLPAQALRPKIEVDAEVGPDELSLDAVAELRVLAPFGEGNQPPVFCLRGLTVDEMRTVGGNAQHLKLWLARDGRPLPAVGFNMAGRARHLERAKTVDVCGTPMIDEFNSRRSVQLKLADVRLAQP